ncbi:hypothetical protein DB347_15530 [Opitutaceae bacterium EW11]|nr:hypothetical protein DB347_15530 [Opitutaceae bacterium EW11]
MWSWPEFTRTLEPLSGRVLYVDANGRLQSFYEASDRPVGTPCPSFPLQVGEDLLARWDSGSAQAEANDSRVLIGLRSVLWGEVPQFRMEFSSEEADRTSWYHVVIFPVTGERPGAVLVQTDVTDQKCEEAGRREAEDRCRSLLQASAAGFVVLNRSGNMVEANPEFLKLAQRSAVEQLRSERLERWTSESDRPKLRTAVENALGTGEPQYLDIEWRPGSGTAPVFLSLTVTRVRYSNEPHVAVFCIDRREQRLAIGTLETEERYRAVVESQTELICRIAPDTTIVFVNEACCRFFGRTREELIGRPFVDCVPASTRPSIRRTIVEVLRETKPVSTEHEMVAGRGRARWVHWVFQSVRQTDGGVELQGIGRDVTDRHRVEEELRRSHRKIRDLAGRLMQVQEEQQRHIARELHDDICQRLAAHSLALTNFGRRLPAGAPALRDAFRRLETESAEIIEGIRSYSHQLHPAYVEQFGICAALEMFCSAFGAQHRLVITLELAKDVPPLPPQMAVSLYRIVQEVFSNIARHAHATHVTVTLRAVDDELTLVVEDDGVGFEMGTAVSSHGFGLISIEERVRYFSGRVAFESQPGQGARITVRIPLSTSAHRHETSAHRTS